MAGGLKKQAEEVEATAPVVKEEATPKQKVEEPIVEQAQEVVAGNTRRDFRN
jgi:hypothetical protein